MGKDAKERSRLCRYFEWDSEMRLCIQEEDEPS